MSYDEILKWWNYIAIASLVVNILVSMGIASWAKSKGRSYAAFFFISFFLTCVVAFIIVASIAPIDTKTSSSSISNQDFRSRRMCPYCDEPISVNAILCKHCSKEVEPIIDETEQVIEGIGSHLSLGSLVGKVDLEFTFVSWSFIYSPHRRSYLSSLDAGFSKESSLIWTEFSTENGESFLLNGFYSIGRYKNIKGYRLTRKPYEAGQKILIWG